MDDFFEELEKKKKKIDNTEVRSPYAGGNKTSQGSSVTLSSDDDFMESFFAELDKATKREEAREIGRNGDIAPVLADDLLARANAIPDSAEAVAEWKKANSKQTKKKDSGGWFDSGAFGDFSLTKKFKDGYDFGDVTKTILGLGEATLKTTAGTALDVATEAFEGIWHIGEGIGEGISKNIIAPIADKMGNEELADTIRENVKNNRAGELYDQFMKPVDDVADSNSILGSKSEGLTQTVSRMYGLGNIGNAAKLAGLGTKGATLLTSSVTFNNSYISGLQEAYRSGATDKEAETYGIISGLAETGSEMLFGGLGKSFNALGYGKGLLSADDMLAAKVTSKMKSTLAKNFAQFAVKAGAEGLEELVAGFTQAVGKWATYMSEEDFWDIVEDENLFEQFVVGALVSGGMQSGYLPGTSDGSLRDANKSGKDFISGLTANEQAVVDSEYKRRIAEAEKNGKVTPKAKNRIYDDILKELEKGGISTDTIEEVLGGETYKSYQDTVKSEDALLQEAKSVNDEFKALNQMKKGDMTGEQSDRLEELRARKSELEEQIKNTKKTSERDFLQKQYKSEVYEIAKGDRLVESYNERARRGQAFEADVSKYDEKQKAIVQKAIDSGFLNNTNATHDFVDFIAKSSADTGVDFDFLNNQKLKDSGFAVDGKTVNGYFDPKTKTVGINLNSKKALNTVVGHEVTHVLEGTKLYDELKNTIIEYAKSKGDYQGRIDALSKLYDAKDIDSELTADLVGDYLFTDSDFINNLSANHRNVFQKIYDQIKHLYKMATAGSKEARELEKVKRAFEKAYQAETKNTITEDGVKYALADIKKITPADEQKNSNIQEVAQMSSVYTVDESKLEASGKGFHEVYGEYFAEWGENIHSEVFGDIATKSSSIRSEIRHGSTSEKIAAIEAIPSVIENGKIVDWKEKHPGSYRIIVAAPINIGDTPYIMGVMLQRDSQYQRLYLHDVVIEKETSDLSQDDLITTGSHTENDSLFTTNILQKILNVKKNFQGNEKNSKSVDNKEFSLSADSDGNALSKGQKEYFKDSKVVDRDGNLLKVYHTTKNDFTVFDDSKKGSTTEGYNTYLGHFFTDNPDYMSEFPDFKGGKTEAYYLNMKNPIDMNNISREAFLDIVEVTGGDVTEAAEVYDTMYAEEVERAKFRNGTPALELSNLLEELTGEYFFDTEFHNALRPNYDKLIAKGYDGVINNMDGAGWANEYVVLNSNQAKLTTNTNPTSDPDVRYSLSAKGESPQAYGNYNVYGKDIALEGALTEDIAPVREDIAPVTENAQEMFPDDFAPIAEEEAAVIENEALDSLTDADAPPEMEMPHYEQRDTGTIDNKSLKGISERASEYLGLNRTERATLEGIIQNYSQNENLTRDDLYSEMKDKFSVLEERVPNEEVVQIKKDLKSMKLYVSDEVKADFGRGAEDGYTKFLRSNFGRLRIVKDITQGVPVDSAYMELSDLYPSYFPDDIINPADQLRKIAEMASMPSEEILPMELSDAEVEAVADMVYTDISDYMNEERLNAAESIYAPHSDIDAPVIETVTEAENKVLSVKEMYEQKKNNYKETLAAYEAGKEKSLANFQEAIGKKLNEYNALKNKNTKRANNLLLQIERLRMRRDNVQADYTNRIAKQQARVEAFENKSFEEFEQKELAVRRKDYHKQIVDNAKAQFEAQGYDLDEVLKNAKNLSTFATVDNTPQRVLEKSLGWKEGHILSDITVNKVAQNETEGIKWLNTITDKKNGLLAQLVADYGIKPGSKESAAAQMYAEGYYFTNVGKEGEYVKGKSEIVKYGDEELAKDFPDSKVRENIKALSKDKRVRQFYDETLDKINESRVRNAYPEIPKLNNYFLHFREMGDFFSRNGLPFNPNDIRTKDLPTDLNGVTADLKPGQPYFASSMHRKGKQTTFDLLGGLEKYATSAKNQIYHIDDIQTLRAIRNYIAESYGQAKGFENLDSLPEEEVQEKIEKVKGSHLSTLAKFLNEEANVIAGKTALTDRGLEGIFGRRGMTTLDNLNRQVGSNMVGYNVSSALTNFVAPVQAFAKTNKADFFKGFTQTVSNRIKAINGKSDGFTEESPVVIRRKGAERYYRNTWQKLSDPGYALMGAVDNFSTELIARAKYNELTRKGMDSETAHVETDKWVSRLMGDRSLGQMPQLYNSKMLGLVTKFQLEVRNQLDSQFYDTIKEANASTEDIQNGLERNAKKAAKIASTFFTLAVGQHLFGKAFESIAGYNPAFDIISVLIKVFGFDDDEESEDTVLDNLAQGLHELAEDMPYSSFVLDGGRIPMSNALLDIGQILEGKDKYGNKISPEQAFFENLAEIAPYYLMPGGYGQFKKTTQGLGMFDEDLPVSGSYTDSGKLRFPVEDNLWKRVQAGLFGQYASENARDYFNNERKALNEKQIQEFIDSGISIQDYWEYREGLSGLKTLNEKADYINSLDLPVKVKNLFINNLSDRKEDIDLSGMGGYSDFNEYDFATKNPEKYEWLKANGISVAEYEGSDEETKEEYDFAFKYPEKYVVSKAVGGYKSYKSYSSDLYDIKADKDEDGKSISGSRKEKVIDYINNMDADYGQKIILFKTEYPADDTYNNDIIEYLNEREDISYEEMVTILRELGFTVKGDQVYWD